MAVSEATKSNVYPEDVHIFLKGLYATLFLKDVFQARDMEKALFFAFRNGYELGASAYGADIEKIHDRFPDFDLEDFTKD